jgi:Arc/MetJ-type ribon-helix-helix transcriptional regulator
MVFGMATTRITITLPDDQIHSIRELVAAGKAGSVSGFVKHGVAVGLFDAAGWRAMLDDALRETGGLGIGVIVPATALAQAIRNPARQGCFSRLIRSPTRIWLRSMVPTQLLSGFCWRTRQRRISSMPTP